MACIYDWGIKAMDEIWSRKAIAAGEMGHVEIDPALHMGMRPRYCNYYFETGAGREGYEPPREDGKYYPRELVDGSGPWAQLPEYLCSGFNAEHIISSVGDRLPVSSST
jgi:hypothetical protein